MHVSVHSPRARFVQTSPRSATVCFAWDCIRSSVFVAYFSKSVVVIFYNIIYILVRSDRAFGGAYL